MHTYLATFLIFIITIGTHEGILRLVEDVEEALVLRQTGTEDGGKHDFIRQTLALAGSQRGLHSCLLITETPTNLVGLKLSYSFQVTAETHPVLLNLGISKLTQILVDDARRLAHIYYFHSYFLFKFLPAKIQNHIIIAKFALQKSKQRE